MGRIIGDAGIIRISKNFTFDCGLNSNRIVSQKLCQSFFEQNHVLIHYFFLNPLLSFKTAQREIKKMILTLSNLSNNKQALCNDAFSRNYSVTRMIFELFPEIASVKTLK